MKKMLGVFVLVGVLAGCGGRGKDEVRALGFAEAAPAKMAASGVEGAEDVVGVERKLVREGEVELEVGDVDAAVGGVREMVEGWGGYVARVERWESGAQVEARVPEGRFGEAMERAGEWGRVLSSSQRVIDVTERYYDLETRLKNAYLLEERYRGYLGEAKTLEDILKVEEAIARVRTEIEQMEGQKRRLEQDISFSRILFTFTLPPEKAPPSYPSLKEGLGSLWVGFVRFLYGLLLVLIGLVVFGIPGIGVLAFLYWLLLGKVGVLRRVFGALSPEGKRGRRES
ncbi:hypothetical protein Spith_1709 [Spirochaeta thermophila DSM 6578]|uniref:DUF4349 domain-containing protein n=1 Tax=Winmispira thermophila (strain ATCC 700085 / DSM 6578 / Z-1203) TaxID=869211 RepID=G0GBV8_WINT7|nr:DUF4349 domain-containing protein [Spirochaeta thermophila]AEJ61969.1 hypothetical protein Spith_1709 [Spirochaeta thermophila DSM 6578]